MKLERKNHLSTVKKLVVKVGSSLITDWNRKKINIHFLNNLARQIQTLRGNGIQCVIVTSGAIASGLFELGLSKKPKEVEQLQALAAIGQSRLMHAYETTFRKHKVKVAQILLTREDLSDRKRYSNAHNTFIELFHHGIVPIVNENDTVAVEEIRFGDNDTLAVLVSHLCEADLLILLTDKDGFFNEDPALNPKARLISDVYRWDDILEKGAGKSTSQVGTGGMLTKIQAAKNMMKSGVPMVIANGRTDSVLTQILNSENIGTFFYPAAYKMPSRKRWLAWSGRSKGELVVDEGAEKALLEKNKSLLPSGIHSISGAWGKGDVVRILSVDGREIAKGISNYSSKDADLIKGLKTSDAFKQLGPNQPAEVVHKDNIVKTGEAS